MFLFVQRFSASHVFIDVLKRNLKKRAHNNITDDKQPQSTLSTDFLSVKMSKSEKWLSCFCI